MFVDYSGLQRFSEINRCFANHFLHLLKYENLATLDERLQFFKCSEKDEVCIQRLEVTDFIEHLDVIDYLFKLSLSIKQMQEVSDIIRRCPTVYVVEIFNSNEINVDIGDVVAWAAMFLRNTYDATRKELCDEIKKLIVDLRPEIGYSSFQDWHVLQRYLFYSYCEDVPKFMEPKTDIVIIPMNFPKTFMDKVNNNGFMSTNGDVLFYTFAAESDHFNLLTSFTVDSIALKPIDKKISTIWKDGHEKEYIGTVWEPCWDNKEETPRNSVAQQPNFVTLFRDCNDEELEPSTRAINKRDNFSPISDRRSIYSETNSHSDKNASLYDIFSPLSSNELPTALTPPNNASNSSPIQIKNYRYKPTSELNDKSNSYALLPPPPSFLPSYQDFEDHRQGFRQKLKHIFLPSSSHHPNSRGASFGNKSLTGFETIGSWADWQSLTWNDMSTKKFIKFKVKKWRSNYHYYKEVVKQCIEDFHDNSIAD